MTDNRTTELLPCPFCGGEAETWDGMGLWHIVCAKCGTVSSPCLTEAEAIAAWNTRAELGSGTCEVECFDDGADEGMDGEWFSYAPPTWYLSCGHTAQGTEKPNFCPVCGKAVE